MFHPLFTSAFYQYAIKKEQKLKHCPQTFLSVVLRKGLGVTFSSISAEKLLN